MFIVLKRLRLFGLTRFSGPTIDLAGRSVICHNGVHMRIDEIICDLFRSTSDCVTIKSIWREI